MAAVLLREAAALLRRRAGDAVGLVDDARWMVDQDEEGGLVLATFVPEDVAVDGTVGSSVLTWFAYPDSPERATYAHALGVASHTAALDPQAAMALAAWLEAAASVEDGAGELVGGAASLVGSATRFARCYLRAVQS